MDPKKPLQEFHEFQTDDPYHEVVTKSTKFFEETMNPVIELPTLIQLSMPSTHDKHQQALPSSSVLQNFDLHSLSSLIKLVKPVNIVSYRELNLGVNFL